jgi:hypothetical protein
MDRFLLAQQPDALRYLPEEKMKVLFAQIKTWKKDETKEESELHPMLKKIHKAAALAAMLQNPESDPRWKSYTEEEILTAVKHNIGNLLYSKSPLHKNKKFFNVLEAYIKNKNIVLTSEERLLLRKHNAPFWKRVLHRTRPEQGDFLHNRDFKNFSVGQREEERVPPVQLP